MFRAGAMFEALSFAPDLASKKAIIDSMSKEQMISVTAKSTQGVLEAGLNIPLEIVAQIISLATAP